ncbi:hypothetical protein C8J57DRAFT_1241555 [Mycena rebaudengoi]|nr:hypothetical protein C8J57DRAFT_1241555 [Mycena rebaudengoi]
MFLRLAFVVASIFISANAAITLALRQGPPITPPDVILCCRTIERCTDQTPTFIGNLLGLDMTVPGLGGINCGLTCSRITVIGNNCGDTRTQCSAPEERWGGLIAFNCIPVVFG